LRHESNGEIIIIIIILVVSYSLLYGVALFTESARHIGENVQCSS